MKSNYKTTSTTPRVNRETNLMRPLTARLEDGTVANRQLITDIRFVSKNYTHPWKGFANRLYLVLHANEILFSKNVHQIYQTRPLLLSVGWHGQVSISFMNPGFSWHLKAPMLWSDFWVHAAQIIQWFNGYLQWTGTHHCSAQTHKYFFSHCLQRSCQLFLIMFHNNKLSTSITDHLMPNDAAFPIQNPHAATCWPHWAYHRHIHQPQYVGQVDPWVRCIRCC